MSNIPHGTTERYYSPLNKIVYDGDTARAADLNAVNDAVDAAFDAVGIDLDTLETLTSNNVVLAERWATHVYSEDPIDGTTGGVSPELEKPGLYSSFMNAQESQGWASAAEGAGIPLADGQTSSEESAKTHAANAEVDAGLADDARILAEAAAETSIGNNNIIAGDGIEVDKVENPPSSGDYDYTVSNSAIGMMENDIINGDLFFWQRGTGPFGGWNANADRWFGNNIGDVINQSTEIPNEEFKYSLAISNDSEESQVGQAILLDKPGEYSQYPPGTDVFVKFWAKVPLDKAIRVFSQWKELTVGAGGSNGDGQVSVGVGTGSWEEYSGTFTIINPPAASAKLFALIIGIDNPVGTDSYITGLVSYKSALEQPVRRRPKPEELAMCQKYLCSNMNDGYYPGDSTSYGSILVYTNETSIAPGQRFPQTMIQNPSVTLYTITGVPGNVRQNSQNIAAVASYIGQNGFGYISGTFNTTGNIGYNFIADAEI